MAAATLDVDMFAVVVENDLGLLESQRTSVPDAILVSDIRLIGSSAFAKFIEKRSITDILIIAGPPCQPNSRMNPDSAEFEDPRAPLSDHVYRVQQEFLSVDYGVQVHLIVEDGAPPPPKSVSTRVDHIAFHVDDTDVVEQLLREHGIEYRASKVADTGVTQLFFCDPDGNHIEIGCYPPPVT